MALSGGDDDRGLSGEPAIGLTAFMPVGDRIGELIGAHDHGLRVGRKRMLKQ
jgi:hypothetical protein